MTEPGVHSLIRAEYDADPCPLPSLSSSIAKVVLNQSPRHAWLRHPRLNPKFEPSDDRKFDLGTAAHLMLLGGDQVFRNIKFDDYRKQEAKQQRDDAIANGFVPVLTHQLETVVAMASAARAQLDRHEEASGAFTNGTPEQTLIWQETEHIWCRARLDWLPLAGPFFDDYKSTGASANPDEWSRTLYNMGADIQAAFYLRGIRALGLHEAPAFRFIVQENTPPYALSVIALSPATLAIGEAKVQRAMEFWGWCIANDSWPGYPRRTAYVDAPPWELTKAEALGAEPTAETLQQMLAWQAPIDQEAA